MATNELERLKQSSLAVPGQDPFLAYGAKAGLIGAQYLSFKNGEWLYGQSDTELPRGTKLAANMNGLRVGWRKWWGARIEQDRTVLLVDQLPEEPRSALGDADPAMWELSPEGKPRDPWVKTNMLELVDYGSGVSYLYSTSSKGGIGCIGELCNSYGRLHRLRPAGETPIVALGNDFYSHPQYGKTYVPTLTIVGWLDTDGKPIEDEEPEPPKPEPAKPARNTAPRNQEPQF